jgi:hypothetical protein
MWAIGIAVAIALSTVGIYWKSIPPNTTTASSLPCPVRRGGKGTVIGGKIESKSGNAIWMGGSDGNVFNGTEINGRVEMRDSNCNQFPNAKVTAPPIPKK